MKYLGSQFEKYAAVTAEKKENHVAALESDAGGFLPIGFDLEMKPEKKEKLLLWKSLFKPYGVHDFDNEGSGADLSPLPEEIPKMELMVNSQRYFDHHHSATDTFDKVNKRELHLGTATMAGMIYLLTKYGL